MKKQTDFEKFIRMLKNVGVAEFRMGETHILFTHQAGAMSHKISGQKTNSKVSQKTSQKAIGAESLALDATPEAPASPRWEQPPADEQLAAILESAQFAAEPKPFDIQDLSDAEKEVYQHWKQHGK